MPTNKISSKVKNMMKVILYLTIFYIHFNISQCLDLRGSGTPVPHAEELDRMLTKFLNYSEFDGTVFRYLFGIESDPVNGTDPENLDIKILDADTIKKIVNKAQRRFQTNPKNDTRRYFEEHARNEHKTEEYVGKILDLMKQSIYQTRLRMRETKPYRDKFRNFVGYNMAIMFGALMSIRTKMEELYALMHNFKKMTHFLWFLVIYEKILAFHVDVTNMCEKIFLMHEERITQAKGDIIRIGEIKLSADILEKFNIDITDPDNLAMIGELK